MGDEKKGNPQHTAQSSVLTLLPKKLPGTCPNHFRKSYNDVNFLLVGRAGWSGREEEVRRVPVLSCYLPSTRRIDAHVANGM